MTPLVVSGAVALVVFSVYVVHRTRAQTLRHVRSTWGVPVRRDRDFRAIVECHESRLQHTMGTGSLDARTWTDLNLDDVFAALDRTTSTLGQHALYHRLRTGPSSDLSAFEALVARAEADARFREQAQLVLSRLTDPHGYNLWWLAERGAIEFRSWYIVFPALAVTAALLLVATLVQHALAPALVASLVLNIAVRFSTDRQIASVATAFRQVGPVIATAESLRALIADSPSPLVIALKEDVPRLRRLKSIARWVSGNPLMLPVGADLLPTVVQDIANSVYEYLNLAFLLDGTGVCVAARILRENRGGVLRVVAAIGDIDSAISTASYRASRQDWVRPIFQGPGAPFAVRQIRHPLIANAVPNGISIDPGEGFLITGSNMSGKSTFLRTLGVTVVMAQTLNTCLANTYSAPVLLVRSCIGRSDDLLSGTSYYVAEVLALLELVQASGGDEPHLFLLDELFRGTNAVERIAAGRAVLLQLAGVEGRPRRHAVVASTHDGELVDLLPDSYKAQHFGDAVGPEGLVFDYRLRPGPSTTRNAITLLRLNGAPPDMVRDASECAARLDAQRQRLAQGPASAIQA